jgi:hypothetical protein
MDLSNNISALSALLGGSHMDQTPSHDTMDTDRSPAHFASPGQIGPPQTKGKRENPQPGKTKGPSPMHLTPHAAKPVSKDIWDAEEVPVSGFGLDEDPRKKPEFVSIDWLCRSLSQTCLDMKSFTNKPYQQRTCFWA